MLSSFCGKPGNHEERRREHGDREHFGGPTRRFEHLGEIASECHRDNDRRDGERPLRAARRAQAVSCASGNVMPTSGCYVATARTWTRICRGSSLTSARLNLTSYCQIDIHHRSLSGVGIARCGCRPAYENKWPTEGLARLQHD